MSLMDVARGAYARSPAMVRRSLAPIVAMVPTKAKFGGTYQRWRADISRAAVDPAFATDRHQAALRALLIKAHAGSPFYRDLIDRSLGQGFDLATLVPSDLHRLPILTKTDLRDAGDAALAVPRSDLDRGDTSGSNGERPFAFYLDRDRSTREMAFVYSAWARVGFTEADAKIVLRGFGLAPRGTHLTEWEPALKELRLSVFPMTKEDVARYIELIDLYKVQYLYGYPSAIELMCRHLDTLGIRPRLPLKGIMPISEPLFPHQRRAIRDTFGDIPVAHFYGLSEKAIFAREVEGRPDVYAFDPLYGRAELVDEAGLPITEPGREGRLVGTGFLSTGMPFIRYDTEDRARLVSLPTPENGEQLVVDQLIPRRKPNFLVSAEGNRVVTIDFTPENPRFFAGVEEYQFFQNTPGQSTIRYILTEDGTDEDAARIAADLSRRTRGAIKFDVERVDRLAGGRAGKRAFIDQRLDISRY